MAKKKTSSELVDNLADIWVEMFSASIKAPMSLLATQIELGTTLVDTLSTTTQKAVQSYVRSVEKLTDALEGKKSAKKEVTKKEATKKEATKKKAPKKKAPKKKAPKKKAPKKKAPKKKAPKKKAPKKKAPKKKSK